VRCGAAGGAHRVWCGRGGARGIGCRRVLDDAGLCVALGVKKGVVPFSGTARSWNGSRGLLLDSRMRGNDGGGSGFGSDWSANRFLGVAMKWTLEFTEIDGLPPLHFRRDKNE